jgi:hypothetical protein
MDELALKAVLRRDARRITDALSQIDSRSADAYNAQDKERINQVSACPCTRPNKAKVTDNQLF